MFESKTAKFFIAMFSALLLYFILENKLEQSQVTLLSLVLFMVILWTNEALPLGVVSMLPIILFPSFDILTTNQTTQNYSKSIIFLFLGGFMLAIAVQKIGLHKVIANKLLSLFPNTPKGVILALAITSALMSSFLSNTTTALLLLPIALFLTDIHELKRGLH